MVCLKCNFSFDWEYGAVQASAASRHESRAALERYFLYFRPYENHQKKLKLESNLKDKVTSNIQELIADEATQLHYLQFVRKVTNAYE